MRLQTLYNIHDIVVNVHTLQYARTRRVPVYTYSKTQRHTDNKISPDVLRPHLRLNHGVRVHISRKMHSRLRLVGGCKMSCSTQIRKRASVLSYEKESETLSMSMSRPRPGRRHAKNKHGGQKNDDTRLCSRRIPPEMSPQTHVGIALGNLNDPSH